MPENNRETSFSVSSADSARQEKLLWYQEVLELDPNSRIFLPYARLLAESGRQSDAVAQLRSGLSKHPEFLEAKLELLDALEYSGQQSAAMAEASELISLLSAHPALWDIWSRMPGIRQDLAAMLVFLGSCMKDEGYSLADVFGAGLRSLRESSQKAPDDSPVPQHGASSEANVIEKAQPPHTVTPDISLALHGLDYVPDDDDIEETQESLPESSDNAIANALSAEADAILPAHGIPPSETEGKCSLYTRSMALVLEEQGAMEEAANIYRELLERDPSQEERAELTAKLENLMRNIPSQENQQNPALLGFLEELAERLEKKSRS